MEDNILSWKYFKRWQIIKTTFKTEHSIKVPTSLYHDLE